MNFMLDVTNAYKVQIVTANTRHRFPNLKEAYEFDTVSEACEFLEKQMGTGSGSIRQRDLKMEHGVLADTSWYRVIKKYRDVPECMML